MPFDKNVNSFQKFSQVFSHSVLYAHIVFFIHLYYLVSNLDYFTLMSQKYSTKQLFVMKSKTLSVGIIESDSLDSFKLQSPSLVTNNNNRKNLKKDNTRHDESSEFVSKLLHLKCSIDSKNSILFDCCKYGSINILSFFINQCKTHNIRLLKKLLCLVSKPRSNTLIMTCVIPSIKGEEVDEQQRKQLLCLDLLLKTMVKVISEKKFQEVINHVNYHNMHLISLSCKYNNINSLKLIFYYCNKTSKTINILNKKYIMEQEQDKKLNKFRNGMYYAKINKNAEISRYLLQIFNGNNTKVLVF